MFLCATGGLSAGGSLTKGDVVESLLPAWRSRKSGSAIGVWECETVNVQ